MKRLANRLGPDIKRIRIVAHARVPWPMEPERKKLDLLEAKEDFDRAKRDMEMAQRMVASGKKAVKAAQESLARAESSNMLLKPAACSLLPFDAFSPKDSHEFPRCFGVSLCLSIR